jgi:hypothetical protein
LHSSRSNASHCFSVGALLLAWFVARHWIVPVRAVAPQVEAA